MNSPTCAMSGSLMALEVRAGVPVGGPHRSGAGEATPTTCRDHYQALDLTGPVVWLVLD